MKSKKEELLKKIELANRRRLIGKRPSTEVYNNLVEKDNNFNKCIFISGGIGDVFSVESFFTNEEKRHDVKFFLASNKNAPIRELLNSIGYFNIVTCWDDFEDFWCFYSLEDFLTKMKSKNISVSKELINAKDASILEMFPKIHNDELTYNKSVFIEKKLSDIDKFNLPEKYILICPYSIDKRIRERDFNQLDWDETLKNLEKLNSKGVVIYRGKNEIPKSDLLIDLTNKASVVEAVEILKKSKGYIGIDSWLSVLATKIPISTLQIKSVNAHCTNHAKCYYSPRKNYSFLVKNIQTI